MLADAQSIRCPVTPSQDRDEPVDCAFRAAASGQRHPADGISGTEIQPERLLSSGRRASRPVGRVLCTRLRGPAAIHLGPPLLAASCGLPASIGRAALNRSRSRRGRDRGSLLTLLRVGFTKPPQSPAALVVSYTTVSPLPPDESGGGLFSVALSRGSPRVGVTDHPALRSPDLPRRSPEFRRAPRPPGRLARRCSQLMGSAPAWRRSAAS